MAVLQMLVRNLDGKTRCLRFPSREVSCEDVKAQLAASEGVPGDLQRLVAGTREVVTEGVLVAGDDGFFPSCTVLLRLRGGKGGFGSLLRGAATKAGQKKTSNFDACRDMSGRRLRHVNAEKKLKEWKAEAKERELERTAEEFLKKQRRTEEQENGIEKELQRARKDSREVREEMGSAVRDGLVEAARLAVSLKRKKVLAVENEMKKARIRSPVELVEDVEDEDEDEASDEEDEAGPSSSFEERPGASGSDKSEPSASCAAKAEAMSSSPDGNGDLPMRLARQASSQNAVMQSGSFRPVETSFESPELSRGSPDSSIGNGVAWRAVSEPTISSSDNESQLTSVSSRNIRLLPAYASSSAVKDAWRVDAWSSAVKEGVDAWSAAAKEEEVVVSSSVVKEEVEASSSVVKKEVDASSSAVKEEVTGPLDFENYNTSKHLEVLGLERLKTQLQKRGLKCGGSLSERAARLFLLKTIPLEKLDISLFAKPPGKAGRK